MENEERTISDSHPPGETWYSRNKKEIKLIQYFLYHLKKNNKKEVEVHDKFYIEHGDFILQFD